MRATLARLSPLSVEPSRETGSVAAGPGDVPATTAVPVPGCAGGRTCVDQRRRGSDERYLDHDLKKISQRRVDVGASRSVPVQGAPWPVSSRLTRIALGP